MNLTKRSIIPKDTSRKNQKLRDSAKDCPHCMGCGLQNNSRDLLCLAHSNLQEDGKGRGLKARDDKGAIVCDTCHKIIDGQIGNLTREQSQAFHHRAHVKTVKWWRKVGLI